VTESKADSFAHDGDTFQILLRSYFFALLLVRFMPMLSLTLAAAILDQPTLSAFEETAFDCIFEHIAIGAHFAFREIGRGFDRLFLGFQKDLGEALVVVGIRLLSKIPTIKALPACLIRFLVQVFPLLHHQEYFVGIIRYRGDLFWSMAHDAHTGHHDRRQGFRDSGLSTA
jgi:hypothetical protein